MEELKDLDRVAHSVRHAKRVLVITGAGISADSGLPTYRGIGGLYNDKDTDEGIPIEVALSGDVMRTRPDITWKHLAHIEENCRHAGPNAAHEIIAKLQDIAPTTVLTQNIDGFHRQAGSQDLIEMHGTLFEIRCTHCGHREKVVDYSGITEFPPACPDCGNPLRPSVVLFGEQLPAPAIRRLEEVLEEGYDVVFSIGTTSVFPYIAQPFAIAGRIGALAIEVNPANTGVSQFADVGWRCGAAAAMQQLWERLSRVH